MEFLNAVLTIVAGLVGFPALLAAVINVLKHFGWLDNGNAGVANAIGHLIVYVGAAVLVLLGKVDLVPGIDVQLSALANFLLAFLALISSMKVAGVLHDRVLRGLPLVGDTYSTWKSDD